MSFDNFLVHTDFVILRQVIPKVVKEMRNLCLEIQFPSSVTWVRTQGFWFAVLNNYFEQFSKVLISATHICDNDIYSKGNGFTSLYNLDSKVPHRLGMKRATSQMIGDCF